MENEKNFSEETKKALLKKARYKCEAPGCHNKTNLTFHHKKHRSSGSEEGINSLENGCVLCQECHMIADNPRTDEERWKFSVFNTRKYQQIGQTEREHFLWEHEHGVTDWSKFINASDA